MIQGDGPALKPRIPEKRTYSSATQTYRFYLYQRCKYIDNATFLKIGQRPLPYTGNLYLIKG